MLDVVQRTDANLRVCFEIEEASALSKLLVTPCY